MSTCSTVRIHYLGPYPPISREHPPKTTRMLRSFFALFLLIFFVGFANAQARTEPLLDGHNRLAFQPVEAPFRAVSLRYGTAGLPAEIFPQLLYRYRVADGETTPWQRWQRERHAGAEPGVASAQLLLLPADLIELEVMVAALDYAPADAAVLRVYTPRAGGHENFSARSGDCPQPDYLERADWCPDGTCTEHPGPSPTAPTHLIVHHSATSNAVTDYDAVVRAIWDFHVNTNGWSDIGYNWLIAPDGTIYLGRGTDVIGAHFCGQNTATSGICILGNYVDTAPSAAALAALERLAAWKLDALGLAAAAASVHAPSGLALDHVSGHRDGCNTVCPGDSLYARLPALRTDIDASIAADCGSALAAPSALDAELESDTGVRLTWTDNSPNETGFELERAPTVNGPFTLLTATAADSTTYLDTEVVSNTPYFYRLRAVNATDTTGYSNQVFILTGFVGTRAVAAPTFSVAPNPARDRLQLTFSVAERRTVELLDPLGRRVLHRTTRQRRSELRLPPLPAGIYYLRVRSARGERSLRVLIQ